MLKRVAPVSAARDHTDRLKFHGLVENKREVIRTVRFLLRGKESARVTVKCELPDLRPRTLERRLDRGRDRFDAFGPRRHGCPDRKNNGRRQDERTDRKLACNTTQTLRAISTQARCTSSDCWRRDHGIDWITLVARSQAIHSPFFARPGISHSTRWNG